MERQAVKIDLKPFGGKGLGGGRNIWSDLDFGNFCANVIPVIRSSIAHGEINLGICYTAIINCEIYIE